MNIRDAYREMIGKYRSGERCFSDPEEAKRYANNIGGVVEHVVPTYGAFKGTMVMLRFIAGYEPKNYHVIPADRNASKTQMRR